MTPLARLTAVVGRVLAWPAGSQQGARRNAMVASTALAARRAERQEVDDYVEALRASARPTSLPAIAQRQEVSGGR